MDHAGWTVLAWLLVLSGLGLIPIALLFDAVQDCPAFDFHQRHACRFSDVFFHLWNALWPRLSFILTRLYERFLVTMSSLVITIRLWVKTWQARHRIAGHIYEAVAEVERFDQELLRRYR